MRLSEFCLAVCIVDDETGALQQLLEASDDADLADAFASVAPLDTTALREMCTTFWTASEAERLQMAADSGADTDSAVNAYLAVRRFTCDS